MLDIIFRKGEDLFIFSWWRLAGWLQVVGFGCLALATTSCAVASCCNNMVMLFKVALLFIAAYCCLHS
jgi:hypothetical protein